jgi:hypothetical protein
VLQTQALHSANKTTRSILKIRAAFFLVVLSIKNQLAEAPNFYYWLENQVYSKYCGNKLHYAKQCPEALFKKQ